MTNDLKFYDSFTDFKDNADGLLITKSQEIPDDYLSNLRKQKMDSASQREGDYMHVASIPVAVHELWLREGYDCTVEPYRRTLRKLREEGLDVFILTNKRV